MIKRFTNLAFNGIFMCKIKYVALMLAPILFFQFNALSQGKALSKYSDLSRFSFAKQKDLLNKAWEVPVFSKDKKTRNKYAEIRKSRTDFLLDGIERNAFVYNEEIVDYVNGIINQLIAANKVLIPTHPLLLIDRNESMNAYSIGGNVLAVNLGLIIYVNTREELALIIESKKTYLVAMDDQSTQIHDTEKNKVIRTIPLSKDGSRVLITPAKEGHIMVIERNKKEKYSRLSIERLD